MESSELRSMVAKCGKPKYIVSAAARIAPSRLAQLLSGKKRITPDELKRLRDGLREIEADPSSDGGER
jgi:hypothetical protein